MKANIRSIKLRELRRKRLIKCKSLATSLFKRLIKQIIDDILKKDASTRVARQPRISTIEYERISNEKKPHTADCLFC